MKSIASMSGCSVNNTLMTGIASVVAMVATELLLDGSVEVEW
jgi:hypothetical protein